MNDKSNKVAKKALEDIRAGVELDSDLTAELHAKETMDYFRSETNVDDVPLLFVLAKKGPESIHKLAVGILKDRSDFPEDVRDKVRNLFFYLWDSRPEPPKIRINLMWRLLDYENLSLDRHKEIYKFICEHWDDFIETQLGYMGAGRSDKGIGDPELVLPNLERRLNDPKTVPSKHWAYFCSAMASGDVPGISRLFERYGKNIDDDFSKTVLKDMYERCSTFVES